jgi:spore coat protein A
VLSAEMVTILGNFSQHNGRYMYHCHILEHEDMDMMRPFVVVPAETAAFMGGHSH